MSFKKCMYRVSQKKVPTFEALTKAERLKYFIMIFLAVLLALEISVNSTLQKFHGCKSNVYKSGLDIGR